ncbi:MAG: tRNA1(Val) (adenine(37)-N6)-methyltransferase [Acholeplasmatales bacterium]|nr:tRNA1(Val) (adenine(37)-N6)-methyltransferase [Acholeplasmatales bacterium]MBR6289677.1 tRNA1(Val) (adenine(37)-N6)-methyltransferase [Acholeplasmatales bacterium]
MPLVCNELLGRPLLKIYQDTDAFNFSIDSMLLASFATITKKVNNICDLCTGNAPIPLYLTLRSKANIKCVEVQKNSYDLAIKSILENKLENQIEVINDNLIGISNTIGKSKFDLVTCNPPYFKVGDHNINPNDKKAIARHEVLATLDDIVKEASILLNSKGYFAMVHRPLRLIEIIDTFRKYKIEPKRLQFVYPKFGSECNHILIEGIKDGAPGLKVLEPILVYGDDGKWTKEILKIYNYE